MRENQKIEKIWKERQVKPIKGHTSSVKFYVIKMFQLLAELGKLPGLTFCCAIGLTHG